MAPTSKRKRGRPSKASVESPQQTLLHRKRRKGHQEDPAYRGEEIEEVDWDEEGEEPNKQFPFPILKPRVRRIPRQTISTKWDVLPQAAQEQVRELLNAIERPVLMSYRNDRRREEAQSILRSILRKLTTKIPRMPFPSQAKEIHFNHEMLLDANRTLEASLTPAIHSINLLKAEIDKEELLLQADDAKLSDLMENAKAVESSRKMRAKQLHPLLKAAKPTEAEDDAETIGLVDVGTVNNTKLDFQPDDALVSLIKQLDGHLKSLGENTAQVKVLGVALANTKAVVDDALYKGVGFQQYEKISST